MKTQIIFLLFVIATLSTRAQDNNWCACNDSLKHDLVMPSDWRNLPKQYHFEKIESTFNGEYCEYKLLKNSEVVAVGQAMKKNYPDGSWYIINDKGLLCCWGDFNTGYKFRRWYCDNKFEIVYKNKKTQIQDKNSK